MPYSKYATKFINVKSAFEGRISKSEVPSALIVTKFPEPLERVSEKNQPLKEKVVPQKSIFSVKVFLALCLLIVLAASFFLLPNKTEESSLKVVTPLEKTTKEETLKNAISSYYSYLDKNELLLLDDYISPKMRNWYGIRNPSVEEVQKNIKDYRDKYPFTVSTIDRTRFNIEEQENGDFYATYPMEYKVKSNLSSDYKVYDLYLTTIWDENFKLVSAQEIRR